MIAAHFTYFPKNAAGQSYYISIGVGATIIQSALIGSGVLNSTSWSTSDVVRVGGFLGDIANLQQFTPGVQVQNNRYLSNIKKILISL